MQVIESPRRTLFQRLTDPHPSISDPFVRRRALTLGQLSFGLLVIAAIAVAAAMIFNEGDPTIEGWGTLGVAVVAYMLSRLPTPVVGSTFILLGWTVIVGAFIFTGDPTADFLRTNLVIISAAVIPLLSLLLASTTVIIVTSVFTMLLTPLFVLVTPSVVLTDVFGPFFIHLVFGVLFIVLALVQRNDILARMAEVEARSREAADFTRSLQSEVEARTRSLETVALVNAQISTILDLDRLLQDVVDLTKERFLLYHSHLYLFNDDFDTLVLASGAGHVGRQMITDKHAIAAKHPTSIVARSAREGKSVLVNDVRRSDTFLPNPLLPETASELSSPLIARGLTIGVLDVQSSEKGYFDANLLNAIELLSGQIAAAISNARLFEAVERTSRHEHAVSAISRQIQSANDLDDILQVTVRELGKALRVPYTAIELKIADNGDN